MNLIFRSIERTVYQRCFFSLWHVSLRSSRCEVGKNNGGLLYHHYIFFYGNPCWTSAQPVLTLLDWSLNIKDTHTVS
jgi:hypothetical protein